MSLSSSSLSFNVFLGTHYPVHTCSNLVYIKLRSLCLVVMLEDESLRKKKTKEDEGLGFFLCLLSLVGFV